MNTQLIINNHAYPSTRNTKNLDGKLITTNYPSNIITQNVVQPSLYKNPPIFDLWSSSQEKKPLPFWLIGQLNPGKKPINFCIPRNQTIRTMTTITNYHIKVYYEHAIFFVENVPRQLAQKKSTFGASRWWSRQRPAYDKVRTRDGWAITMFVEHGEDIGGL